MRESFACEVLEARRLLAAGGLDPSFGGDGTVTLELGPDLIGTAYASVVQPDGKTVIAGGAVKLDGNVGVASGFAVVRLNINGTPDTSFGPGGDGVAVTLFGQATRAFAVTLQPDGKVLAAGISGDEFAVVRYNANGTVDTSFDGDGRKTFTFDSFSGSSVARDVLVQLDGKIVVCGDAYTGIIDGNFDFAFARLNPDGSFDDSFDGDGKRVVGFGGSEGAHAMAVDYTGTAATNPRYGSIVAAGRGGPGENDRLLVSRLRADGSVDSTFDGDGRVELSYAADFYTAASGLVIQPDGRIVVAGSTGRVSGTPLSGLVMARLQPNGQVDPSFGSSGDGWVFADFGIYRESAIDLINSADGGLLLGGADGSSSVTGGKNVLCAYTADGAPDARFPGGGKVVLPFSGATDVAPGPGRRFVFAGGRGFAVARLFDVGANLVYAATLNPTASETGPTSRGFFVYRLERLPYPTRVYFDVRGTAAAPRFGARTRDYTSEGLVFPIAFPGVPDTPYADIPADQTFTVVTITPLDDALAEGNETAEFTIRPDPAYEVGDPRSVRLTIVDNDAPPPSIDRVYVRGSSWQGLDGNDANVTFKEYLAARGLGDIQYGYRVDSLPAGAVVPWTNVNQLVLHYNFPPTGAAIPTTGGVSVNGARFGYTVAAVQEIDARTFLLTLDRPLGSDLSGGGNGDRVLLGAAGGNGGAYYELRFNVLPGDVNASGAVLADDVSEVKRRFFRGTSSPVTGSNDYTPFHDVDASGSILASDFSEVKKRFFDTLPPVNFTASTFGSRRARPVGRTVLGIGPA